MPTVNFNVQVPGYEILAELGRGNTRVLKARHLASGTLVAIKQYAFATDAETLRRFEQESQIMTQIEHPNVVRVREVQLGAAMPFVVMDFVEGGDLRMLLRKTGLLPIPTTIRLGLQLLGAFRAMHPLNVVHRDVKPENVLYRPLASGELHFLLTDFGIAKLRADNGTQTRTGQSLMTYEYAAPEQFDNPRQVDEAADYYALGVVLYECLTGTVPYRLHDETGLAHFMQQVLTAPIPTPTLPAQQALPPSLATLLTGLLARNPAERLRDADQVELLLEQSRVEYLKGTSSPQTPVGSPTQTIAGPVVMAATASRITDQPTTLPVQQEAGLDWKWWGIPLLVLAVGIAVLVYTRSPRQAAAPGLTQIDSTARMLFDSTQSNPESTGDRPVTTQPTDTEEILDNQPQTEPALQLPADSVRVNLPAPAEDSVRVMPADSVH